MKVRYLTNNSGGDWWLEDKDWKALEKAGWTVKWKDKEFLDAKATEAYKECDSVEDAMDDFQKVTGQDPEAEGCECCGQPHYFSGVKNDV